MRHLGPIFASPLIAALPTTPIPGQTVTLAGNGVTYVYTGGAWSAVGASGQTIIDFGTAGGTNASVLVSDNTIVSSAIPAADLMIVDSADHSADEHLMEDINVHAGPAIAGTGFYIFASTGGPYLLRGKFNVSWSWS